MEWINWLIVLTILGAGVLAIRRLTGAGVRGVHSGTGERKVIPSPFSQGLTHLVGVAGGIYLGLITLTSFLQLDIPQRVDLGFTRFDPLAATAIVLSLIQPYFIRRDGP